MPPRKPDLDLQARAVSQVIDCARPATAVAEELGCSPEAVSEWVKEELQFYERVMDRSHQLLSDALTGPHRPPLIEVEKEATGHVVAGMKDLCELGLDPRKSAKLFLHPSCVCTHLVIASNLLRHIFGKNGGWDFAREQKAFSSHARRLWSRHKTDILNMHFEAFRVFWIIFNVTATHKATSERSMASADVREWVSHLVGDIDPRFEPSIGETMPYLRRRIAMAAFGDRCRPSRVPNTGIAPEHAWAFSVYCRVCAALLPLSYALAFTKRALHLNFASALSQGCASTMSGNPLSQAALKCALKLKEQADLPYSTANLYLRLILMGEKLAPQLSSIQLLADVMPKAWLMHCRAQVLFVLLEDSLFIAKAAGVPKMEEIRPTFLGFFKDVLSVTSDEVFARENARLCAAQRLFPPPPRDELPLSYWKGSERGACAAPDDQSPEIIAALQQAFDRVFGND